LYPRDVHGPAAVDKQGVKLMVARLVMKRDRRARQCALGGRQNNGALPDAAADHPHDIDGARSVDKDGVKLLRAVLVGK
jgi:hypothetical protein